MALESPAAPFWKHPAHLLAHSSAPWRAQAPHGQSLPAAIGGAALLRFALFSQSSRMKNWGLTLNWGQLARCAAPGARGHGAGSFGSRCRGPCGHGHRDPPSPCGTSHRAPQANPAGEASPGPLAQLQGLWQTHLPAFSSVHEPPRGQGIKFLVSVSVLNVCGGLRPE